MRTVALSILGIGAPLVLMTVGWVWWTSPPEGAPTPASAGEYAALTASRAEPTPTNDAPASRGMGHPTPTDRRERPGRVSPPPVAVIPLKLADAADGWLERWREEIRDHPGVKADVAMVQLAHGRYDAALRAFDRLLLSAPDDPRVLEGKALALVGLGRADDAIPLFEHAIERRPDDASTRLHFALALTGAGRRGEAVRAYEELLDRDPHHPRALFNLAVLHQVEGRAFDALETWTRLTEPADAAPASSPEGHSPDRAVNEEMLAAAWFHRGELAIELSRLDEAELCFGRVVELHPNDAAGWCNLGIARDRLGRREPAITALTEALRQDPELIPALNQLAYVHAGLYRDIGDPRDRDAVKHWCDRSLALYADQPNLRALRDAIDAPAETSWGLGDVR